jgi:hypothetical protein
MPPWKNPKKSIEYIPPLCCPRRMKKNLLQWTAVIGTVGAVSLSSCTYDAAYTSVSGSYSSGYGYGYGYGGSGFNTSVFVSTGDPRWGYDPYTYCYYDYRTRRYYDPYLYGYYPIGYRPPVLIGVPHPYGWRPGRSYCPPPRAVQNVTVVNYRNRETAYRKIDQSWARNVRTKDYRRDDHRGRVPEPRQSTRDVDRNTRDVDRNTRDVDRSREGERPPQRDRSWFNPGNRGVDNRMQPAEQAVPGRGPGRDARPPAGYQTPITSGEREFSGAAPATRERQEFDRRSNRGREFNAPPAGMPQENPGFRSSRGRDRQAPAPQPEFAPAPAPQPTPPQESRPSRGEARDPDSPRGNQDGRRGLRSLGDG